MKGRSGDYLMSHLSADTFDRSAAFTDLVQQIQEGVMPWFEFRESDASLYLPPLESLPALFFPVKLITTKPGNRFKDLTIKRYGEKGPFAFTDLVPGGFSEFLPYQYPGIRQGGG